MKYYKDQEERFIKECTFKPQMRENDYLVSSRYMQLTDEMITNKLHPNELYNANSGNGGLSSLELS